MESFMNRVIYFFLFFSAINAAAQTFSIFDVDKTAFPTMKAKFYVIDATGKQIKNINAADVQITESGAPRDVTFISCPPEKPAERISSTVVIDVSGSMFGAPLDIAKMVAKTWINALPLGQSDCAVVSFDHNNYFNQDFTTNRNKLLGAVDALGAYGGTDYNMAMIEPVAGGILVAKTAKYKKVIIFITDGMPNEDPAVDKIIKEAQDNGITIYCLTIGLAAHYSMKMFAEQTNGMWFERIKDEETAKRITQLLLSRAIYSGEFCELRWKSEYPCEHVTYSVNAQYGELSERFDYKPPVSTMGKLGIAPSSVLFKRVKIGSKSDTTIQITALNEAVEILKFDISNPNFSISPPTLSLGKGETKSVTLSYLPPDSASNYAEINVITNYCSNIFYALGGINAVNPKLNTLRVIAPNGGEKFFVGSDTLIKWTGVLPTDTVALDYSYDNGITWKMISPGAVGGEYLWKNVPKPASSECLVKATAYGAPPVQWVKSYNGKMYEDVARSVRQSRNGNFLVVGDIGTTNGNPKYEKKDIWLLQLNPIGDVVWESTIGGDKIDNGTSLVEMDDEGILVGGYSNSLGIGKAGENPRGFDAWVVKVDAGGGVIWNKILGGAGEEAVHAMEKTIDGDVICVGSSSSSDGDLTGNFGGKDFWAFKLDPLGNYIWKKNYGSKGQDEARAVANTSDGGYIIAGSIDSTGGNVTSRYGLKDCWIVKINFDGDIEWQRTYGGSGNDEAHSIIQTADGGYLFIATTESYDNNVSKYYGMKDIWIVKLKPNGDIEWQRTIGGSKNDVAYSVVETEDYGYAIAASVNSNDGNVDVGKIDDRLSRFWIIKLDIWGRITWHRHFYDLVTGGGNSIQTTSDGGLICAGFVNYKGYDYFAVKLSSDMYFQSDVSDSLFSIVSPTIASRDIDLGKALLGSYKDTLITSFIENLSLYDCPIKDLRIKGANASDFYVISNKSFTLAPGEKKAIEFHFAPSALGNREAQIEIESQDSILTQNIKGEGINPRLQVLSKLIDFGTVEVTTKKDTAVFVVKNLDPAPLIITEVKMLGPDNAQFEIIEGGGSFQLTGNGSREMKLRFKPVSIGRTSCDIGFYFNGTGSPERAKLYGQGVGGNLYCEDDSAYAGEKVTINMIFTGASISSLKSVAKSFTSKIRYLKGPLSIVDNSLIIGETADSITIKVDGTIGADSVLFPMEFVAMKSEIGYTPIEIIDFKFLDEAGSEVEYEPESFSGSFKLLKHAADVYCTKESAYPGENVTFKLINSGPVPGSLQSVAAKFDAKIRYLKAPLEILDKSLLIGETADSATIQLQGNIEGGATLSAFEFKALPGGVSFTNLDIIDFRWLNSDGQEIVCSTGMQSGSFTLLSRSGKIFCTSDSAYPGEKVTLKLITDGIDHAALRKIASGFSATLRCEASLLAAVDKSIPIDIVGDSAFIVVSGPITSEKALSGIEFIAGLGRVDATTIDITNFKWIDANGHDVAFETETESGSFKLLGVCREGGERLFNPTGKAGIMGLSPNPASGEITVTFNQVEAGETSLNVYNILGEVVARVKIDSQSTGKKELRIDLSKCGPGLYYARYLTPSGADARSFVIE